MGTEDCQKVFSGKRQIKPSQPTTFAAPELQLVQQTDYLSPTYGTSTLLMKSFDTYSPVLNWLLEVFIE